jgi:hypothetical protein
LKGAIQTCLAVLSLAILVTAGVCAHAETYYRWHDERGNPVHSDRPPPAGTPYEVISTGSKLVRQVEPDEGAVPATTEPTVGNEFEQVDTGKTGVQKNPEQCKIAQENLQTLSTKVRIQIRDEQGDLRYLSEEEKEAQRKQAIDAIAVHCE